MNLKFTSHRFLKSIEHFPITSWCPAPGATSKGRGKTGAEFSISPPVEKARLIEWNASLRNTDLGLSIGSSEMREIRVGWGGRGPGRQSRHTPDDTKYVFYWTACSYHRYCYVWALQSLLLNSVGEWLDKLALEPVCLGFRPGSTPY